VVIVDDYRVVGREGRGRWLPRTSAGLAAPAAPPVAAPPGGGAAPFRAGDRVEVRIG
jgi:hypothetical protein